MSIGLFVHVCVMVCVCSVQMEDPPVSLVDTTCANSHSAYSQ